MRRREVYAARVTIACATPATSLDRTGQWRLRMTPPGSRIRVHVRNRIVIAAFAIATATRATASPLFASPFATFAVGHRPNAVAAADLNGDGRPDLVVTNLNDGGQGTVSVLLADANGGFRTERRYETGRYPRTAVIGDVNGDG